MNCLVRWTVIVIVLSATAFAQSLGDVARQNRATPHKKAAHVYDEDSIPSSADTKMDQSASEPETNQGEAEDSAETTDAAKKAPLKQTAKKANGEEAKSDDPDEAAKKQFEAAQAAIAEQKRSVDLLQRELDVENRETQLQMAAYYADAGTQLRDSKAWGEQLKKHQEVIDAKTEALQKAKDQLESMREDARKAGVPSSYLD